MKRYVTAILIVMLVSGVFEAPAAQAQALSTKELVKVGAVTGGLFGTYGALVCYGKNRCTPRASLATLGIYTGAGIGAFAILRSQVRLPSHRPNSAPRFEGVQSFVKPGDRVAVRDASGSVSEGIIETVSDSALRLRVGNSSRDYSGFEVAEISRRRHFSDGRLIIPGVIVGLAAGAVAFPNTNSGKWCTGKGAGTCVIGTAALGGVLFAGLSAIPKRKQTIFSQGIQRRTTGVDFNIAPLLSKDSRGASVTVSF